VADTRTIEQQLTDAVITVVNAAGDIPNVLADRAWDVEPEEVAAAGVIILADQASAPVERQEQDDPADHREVMLGLAIWAPTRARADAIRARLQQLLCCTAPVGSASPFFHFAKRIRPGAWTLVTKPSGHALGALQLNVDTQQTVTDPTRWH